MCTIIGLKSNKVLLKSTENQSFQICTHLFKVGDHSGQTLESA